MTSVVNEPGFDCRYVDGCLSASRLQWLCNLDLNRRYYCLRLIPSNNGTSSRKLNHLNHKAHQNKSYRGLKFELDLLAIEEYYQYAIQIGQQIGRQVPNLLRAWMASISTSAYENSIQTSIFISGALALRFWMLKVALVSWQNPFHEMLCIKRNGSWNVFSRDSTKRWSSGWIHTPDFSGNGTQIQLCFLQPVWRGLYVLYTNRCLDRSLSQSECDIIHPYSRHLQNAVGDSLL